MTSPRHSYGLSPLQRGLLGHAINKGSEVDYLQQMDWVIDAGFDAIRFKVAWEVLIARHEVLRTKFEWEGREEPVQVVEERVEVPWQAYDWRGESEEEQRERLAGWLREDREQGFELGRAPLMRLTVIRTSEQGWVFVWSHHHIVLDGWSVAVLLKELLQVYEGLGEGREVALEPVRPYGEYIEWLGRQRLDGAEQYWRERLRGFGAPTALPKHRNEEESGFEQSWLKLSGAASARLRGFARRSQVTVNTVVQGAWGLLLSRYSGERDVVFGATTSGRSGELEGIEQMVGLFINTLPVRVQISSERGVQEWLRQLQQEQMEWQQYEYTPLLSVQNWSELPRGTPLFDSILVFENYPVDTALRSTKGEISFRSPEAFDHSHFGLSLDVVVGNEMSFRAYSRDQYSRSDLSHFLEHVEIILECLIKNSNRALANVPSLSPAERMSIHEWNHAPSKQVPVRDLFLEMFEAQAKRTPTAVAVMDENQRLTYRALNVVANRLARSLGRRGVGPECVVAVVAERSVLALAAIVAILKAGGAWLPISPEDPPIRIAHLLREANVGAVLANKQIKHHMSDLANDWLEIDCLLDEEENGTNLTVHPCCESLAYVMFTSGSTGQPKGVMIRHGGMANHLCAKLDDLEVSSNDILAQVASPTFDIWVWQSLAPLLCGACVAIGGDETAKRADRLCSWLGKQGVTIFETVPSMCSEILSRNLAVLPALRTLLLTGERLSPLVYASWRKSNPHTTVWNVYGPTECSDDVTHYNVDTADVVLQSIPIGRPIANTEVYVVDEAGELSPIGVTGELYIGGAGLARGYLNRPGLTAERFVPHGFGKVGERLYRTGDLGRWRSDGVLEFVGRRDEQVKIRGYRIELGEIETVLREHGQVREAVVMARAEEGGTQRLLAWYVAAEGVAPGPGELREYLRERLPEYMIPAALIALEKLPLTTNGKVDRKALPDPHYDRQVSKPPEILSDTELLLAEIWKEVLKTEDIALGDSFFELGGDSLLAARILSRIRSRFGIEMSLREFLYYQTFQEFAGSIESVLSSVSDLA